MELEEIEVSDLVIGKIYKYTYSRGDASEIFRYIKDSNNCPTLEIWNKHFYKLTVNKEQVVGDRISKATQEEKDWFEFCELHNKYFEQDYALEHSEPRQLREFIKEHNL